MRLLRLFILVLGLLVAGCGVSRQTLLQQSSAHAAELDAGLESLESKRAAAQRSGTLDSVTNSRILALLQHHRKGLDRHDSLGDRYSRARLHRVDRMYRSALEDVVILNDLFKAAPLRRYNSATFFGPGAYVIQLDGADIRKSMDSIGADFAAFAAKWEHRKLEGLFIVEGYADEQPIGRDSPLYAELIKSGDGIDSTRTALNKELSRRRALSVIELMKKTFADNRSLQDRRRLDVKYLAMGKGEILPRATAANVGADDESRRVVLIYWSIVPQIEK